MRERSRALRARPPREWGRHVGAARAGVRVSSDSLIMSPMGRRLEGVPQASTIDSLRVTCASRASTIDAVQVTCASRASTIDTLRVTCVPQASTTGTLRVTSASQASTTDTLRVTCASRGLGSVPQVLGSVPQISTWMSLALSCVSQVVPTVSFGVTSGVATFDLRAARPFERASRLALRAPRPSFCASASDLRSAPRFDCASPSDSRASRHS